MPEGQPLGQRDFADEVEGMPTLTVPIAEQDLAKLDGEGDFPFFVALMVHGQRKIFHVNIRHRKIYDRIHAAAAVEDGRHDGLHPTLIEGARLEPD